MSATWIELFLEIGWERILLALSRIFVEYDLINFIAKDVSMTGISMEDTILCYIFKICARIIDSK